jgi:hypothetical protein
VSRESFATHCVSLELSLTANFPKLGKCKTHKKTSVTWFVYVETDIWLPLRNNSVRIETVYKINARKILEMKVAELSEVFWGFRGSAVVKAPCHRPESRGFETR